MNKKTDNNQCPNCESSMFGETPSKISIIGFMIWIIPTWVWAISKLIHPRNKNLLLYKTEYNLFTLETVMSLIGITLMIIGLIKYRNKRKTGLAIYQCSNCQYKGEHLIF